LYFKPWNARIRTPVPMKNAKQAISPATANNNRNIANLDI